MKLVISCLLMCACFLSSLERVLARWPWGLAGVDRSLVFGVSRSSVPDPLAWHAGEVYSDERGFPWGFCSGGDWEVLCWQVSWGPLWEAGSAWLGVSGRGLLLQSSCGGSWELTEAGIGS